MLLSSLIEAALRAETTRYEPATLIGISCLADGADQTFAREVLDRGSGRGAVGA